MAEAVSIQELIISSLAQTDALAKLLMDKGIITQQRRKKEEKEKGSGPPFTTILLKAVVK